jgi:hypothetical protein
LSLKCAPTTPPLGDNSDEDVEDDDGDDDDNNKNNNNEEEDVEDKQKKRIERQRGNSSSRKNGKQYDEVLNFLNEKVTCRKASGECWHCFNRRMVKSLILPLVYANSERKSSTSSQSSSAYSECSSYSIGTHNPNPNTSSNNNNNNYNNNPHQTYIITNTGTNNNAMNCKFYLSSNNLDGNGGEQPPLTPVLNKTSGFLSPECLTQLATRSNSILSLKSDVGKPLAASLSSSLHVGYLDQARPNL